MRAPWRTARLLAYLLLLGVVTLFLVPPPSAALATAPSAAAPMAVHPTVAAPGPAARPALSPSAVPSGASALLRTHPSISLPSSAGRRLASTGPPTPSAAGLLTKPKPAGYSWTSAYVDYDPTDPQTLLFAEGTGMVANNPGDGMVFFGGLGTGGLSNVTLIYNWWYDAKNLSNTSQGWNYTDSPVSPTARTNMSFVAYQAGGEALLFGGLTNLATQRTANDSWIYNFVNDTWTNVTVPGGPPPREEAAIAVDQADGLALLFGGIAPSFTSRGSTGSVIWQDTWLFDFHTDLWRQIATPVAPNGRFGASMAWDPVAREFLLVAGCGLSCAMDAWAFRLNSTSWVQLPQSGTIPPGRAGATFAWDPGAQQALLYGGMSFDSNGTQVVYSDAYKFLPNGGWTRFTPAAPGPPTIYQPGPIFDAAATWVNFPDCDVLFIAGGNPALTSVTGMVYAIMPNNDTPYFQCWWWFSIPVGPAGPPPACSHASELVVTVEDDATHVPIPNAIVSVSGQCLPAIGYTGSDGSVEFTIPTPDNLSLNVSAPAYHGNATWYNYTYINSTANNTNRLIRYIVITLVAFPKVNIQVLGNNGGIFLYPVPFAAVALNNVSVIAVTRTNGWGNASGISDFNRTAVVSASAENYSSSWKAIRIPYTGEINATLVILKAGTLTVLVVDSRNAHPIPGAHGLLTRLDPGLPSPFHFVTGANGRYSTQLPLGNYSATATATGFLPETVGRSAFLPWIENATIQLSMTLDYWTNVSVQLLDAETGHPIGGGSVTFGGSPPHVAPASGVVKGIDLGPPGPMKIVGYAAGYQQNSTTVTLGYNLVLPMVTLRLVPLCPLSCQAQRNAGPPGVSPLLPAGGSGLLLLLAAPAFLVVGGAMYAILGSVRRSATAGPVGRSFARGAGALERGDAP